MLRRRGLLHAGAALGALLVLAGVYVAVAGHLVARDQFERLEELGPTVTPEDFKAWATTVTWSRVAGICSIAVGLLITYLCWTALRREKAELLDDFSA